MKKQKTITLGEVNEMKGKSLTDMGFRVDSDGNLIADRLEYLVTPRSPLQGGWLIKQKAKVGGRKSKNSQQ